MSQPNKIRVAAIMALGLVQSEYAERVGRYHPRSVCFTGKKDGVSYINPYNMEYPYTEAYEIELRSTLEFKRSGFMKLSIKQLKDRTALIKTALDKRVKK